jgi:hypothetical protein
MGHVPPAKDHLRPDACSWCEQATNRGKNVSSLSALINDPISLDTMEAWERHLIELKSLDLSKQTDEEIKRAEGNDRPKEAG